MRTSRGVDVADNEQTKYGEALTDTKDIEDILCQRSHNINITCLDSEVEAVSRRNMWERRARVMKKRWARCEKPCEKPQIATPASR